MAIVDTGTTGHFLTQHHSNTHHAHTPIHVKLPNGHTIHSTHTTRLHIPQVPDTATQAHVFPDLHPHSLLSVGLLCDHDCTATFTRHNVTIHRNGTPILHGHRLPNGLWTTPLTTQSRRCAGERPDARSVGRLGQPLEAPAGRATRPSVGSVVGRRRAERRAGPGLGGEEGSRQPLEVVVRRGDRVGARSGHGCHDSS